MTNDTTQCLNCSKVYPATKQYFVPKTGLCWQCNKYLDIDTRKCIRCKKKRPVDYYTLHDAMCDGCVLYQMRKTTKPRMLKHDTITIGGKGYTVDEIESAIGRALLQIDDQHKAIVEGLVYFIEASELNRIKIGITQEDIVSRMKGMQGQSPAKLRCIGTIYSKDAVKLERMIQRRFSKFWFHGEWFTFDDSIREYISKYAEPCNVAVDIAKSF